VSLVAPPLGAVKNIVQNLGHPGGAAMPEAVGEQGRAGRIGAIEPLHPLRHLGKQLGIAGHHHHGVHARDRLEADHTLAKPAV
jgi:hypothetical protein